jgi:hypothetical protein
MICTHDYGPNSSGGHRVCSVLCSVLPDRSWILAPQSATHTDEVMLLSAGMTLQKDKAASFHHIPFAGETA